MMQQQAPQQGSSNMMFIILAVVGLLLVCCCGGGAVWAFLGRSAASTLAPVPVPEPVQTSGPSVPNSGGSGGSGTAGPRPTTDQSMTVTVVVDAASGVPGVVPGSTCVFPIAYHADSGDLNCQAHATCAGVALYGDSETNGFFPCTLSMSPPSVVGADNGTTAADQDPSFVIDSTTGTLIIADDSTGRHGAFTVTGHITVR